MMISIVEAIICSIIAGACLLILVEKSRPVSQLIVQIVAKFLPKSQRADMMEQWIVDIENIDGDFWRLINALGLIVPTIKLFALGTLMTVRSDAPLLEVQKTILKPKPKVDFSKFERSKYIRYKHGLNMTREEHEIYYAEDYWD